MRQPACGREEAQVKIRDYCAFMLTWLWIGATLIHLTCEILPADMWAKYGMAVWNKGSWIKLTWNASKINMQICSYSLCWKSRISCLWQAQAENQARSYGLKQVNDCASSYYNHVMPVFAAKNFKILDDLLGQHRTVVHFLVLEMGRLCFLCSKVRDCYKQLSWLFQIEMTFDCTGWHSPPWL